jgi:hypothetical protein
MKREAKEAAVAAVFTVSLFMFLQWALHHGLHGRTCAECVKDAPRLDCVGRTPPCGPISNQNAFRSTP